MPLDARRASLGGDAGRIDTAAATSNGSNGVGAPEWAGRPGGAGQGQAGQSFLDQGPRAGQGFGPNDHDFSGTAGYGGNQGLAVDPGFPGSLALAPGGAGPLSQPVAYSYPGVAEGLREPAPTPQRAQRKGLPRTLAMVMLSTVATSPLAIISGGVTTIVGATQVIGFALVYALVGFAMLAFSLASSAVVSHTGVAAGIHTYVARGLGERMGLGVGTLAVTSYNAYAIGYYGIIGFEVSKQVSEGSGHPVPWGLVVVPFVALVAFLGTRTLRTTALVIGVILLLVIVAHFIFDFTAFTSPASTGLTGEALDPATLFTGAVGAAVGFSITAFPGVEASMALGGELKATSRQVTRATYLSVLLVGGLNVLAAWLVTVALGPEHVASLGGNQGSDPVFNYLKANIGDALSGIFGLLNLVGVVGSILVFHSTAARYMRSMAAAGVLPAALAKRSRKGVPVRASLVQSAITAIVLVSLGVAGASPLWGVFMVLSHIAAIGLILILVLCSVAVMIFLLRSDSDEGGFLGWEGRLVAAIIAALTLTAVLISALLEGHVRLNVEPGSPLVYVPPSVVLVGLLVGILWPRSRRSARSLALDEEDENVSESLDVEIPGSERSTDWRGTPNSATPYKY
jgi:amino acid transporter